MNIFTRFLVALAASLTLFAGSLLASEGNPTGTNATTSSDVIEVLSEVRHIDTRSRKKRKKRKRSRRKSKGQSISVIRAEAIRDTLNGLGGLRPYTTSYKRLKKAVRRYWKRNVRHPSAKGLSRTIMRYVKRSSRSDVRSAVYSGSKQGVRKVKRALKRRKK